MKCWRRLFHKFELYGEPIKQGFVVANLHYAWFMCHKCGRLKILECDENGKRLK